MTRLRWTKDNIRFTDHSRGFTAKAGIHEVPDDVADRYLSHRSGGWERVGDEPAEDTTDEPDGESDGYNRDELESMDWSDLRALAVESDQDGINGHSSKAEIIEAFADD